MILQNWTPCTLGEFKADLIQQLPSYKDHVVLKSPGAVMQYPQTLLDCLAYVLIVHEDPEQLEQDYKIIQELEEHGNLFPCNI